jgi:hypothetical protein
MSDLSHLSGEHPIDLDELRHRLTGMNDAELRRFGDAARYMSSPSASWGEPPREVCVVQLREAREEWKRRYKQ